MNRELRKQLLAKSEEIQPHSGMFFRWLNRPVRLAMCVSWRVANGVFPNDAGVVWLRARQPYRTHCARDIRNTTARVIRWMRAHAGAELPIVDEGTASCIWGTPTKSPTAF